jgi:bifunctional non-homologous end joining protein LigD
MGCNKKAGERKRNVHQMSNTPHAWQFESQIVQVSYLEKHYWPQSAFSKGDMLSYYQQVAPIMLPYFKDRPVTLRMFPNGVEGGS